MISDYSNEQEVSSWEKESLQFKLSNLIESKNVKNIKNEKFVSISSILGSITNNKQKDKIKEFQNQIISLKLSQIQGLIVLLLLKLLVH